MPAIASTIGNPIRRRFSFRLSTNLPGAVSSWQDGGYQYYRLAGGSGNFSVTELPMSGSVDIEYQLVGGGGGGGPATTLNSAYYFSNASGGGGAGGSILVDSETVADFSSYDFSVGAGGTGGDNTAGSSPDPGYSNATSTNGSDTTFGTSTAAGGMAGGMGSADDYRGYGYLAYTGYTQLGSFWTGKTFPGFGGRGTSSPLGTFNAFVGGGWGFPTYSDLPIGYFSQGARVTWSSNTTPQYWNYGFPDEGTPSVDAIRDLMTLGGSGAGGNASGRSGGGGYTLWDGVEASKGGDHGGLYTTSPAPSGYGSGGHGDWGSGTHPYPSRLNGISGAIIIRWEISSQSAN